MITPDSMSINMLDSEVDEDAGGAFCSVENGSRLNSFAERFRAGDTIVRANLLTLFPTGKQFGEWQRGFDEILNAVDFDQVFADGCLITDSRAIYLYTKHLFQLGVFHDIEGCPLKFHEERLCEVRSEQDLRRSLLRSMYQSVYPETGIEQAFHSWFIERKRDYCSKRGDEPLHLSLRVENEEVTTLLNVRRLLNYCDLLNEARHMTFLVYVPRVDLAVPSALKDIIR